MSFWIADIERHEALFYRVEVKDSHPRLSQQPA